MRKCVNRVLLLERHSAIEVCVPPYLLGATNVTVVLEAVPDLVVFDSEFRFEEDVFPPVFKLESAEAA